ncbi:hypothetical protein BU24DRAFT_180013 [Aaosphaeria arxii CBS 175.79]|uniref:WSC domain-containing protein n=1 Tax=Aaosphaeria arxii CBS 175.79 TaxID=1450172 RepID=A0A6A5XRR3_9PLEO|nr:uncharacterized protein BU24DRAFT_180013 [Aaosphaeria arxii CBS 175.79]KAF2015527.1 hypothetical protein BU24DRAFT_180013 [Aaosphaeria arxii CBS 175.79]
MARSNSIVLAGSLALLAFLSTAPSATEAFVVEYCSTQNTNSGGQTWHNDWQSNGLCTGKCGAYAFAVIQYKDCWCSNYIPEAQDDTSDCDGTCPGFPSEICGSNSGDKFVYIPIDGKKPSGTKGASEPTQVSTTSSPPVPSSDSSTRPTSTEISTVSELHFFAVASLASPLSLSFSSSL